MRTTRSSVTALAGGAVLALALAACGSSSEAGGVTASGFPETITLGAIPAENSTDLAAGYEPVVKLLEKETGSEVELSQASDYAGVLEGLIAGKVDIAFLGSFAYVIGTQNQADITPLGAVVSAKGEAPGYYSLGITQKDNAAINGLADFKGKDVCFVDPGSTSGFLYPTAGLITDGLIASGREKDLSAALKPVFAGGHDASALGVAKGECDAGFAMQSMVEKTLVEKGEIKAGDLKQVWKSEKISGSLFVGSNELGAPAIAKLTSILTEKANADYLKANGYCTGECLITDEDAWGVAPAKDSDYDGVRAVCAATKSDKCQG